MPLSRAHNMVFLLRVEFTQRLLMISSDVKLLPDRLTPCPTIPPLFPTPTGILYLQSCCVAVLSHCIDSL